MDAGCHDGHWDNDEDRTSTTNSTMRTGVGDNEADDEHNNEDGGQGWECQRCDDKETHADNDEDANRDADDARDDKCHDDEDGGREHENEDGGHDECYDRDANGCRRGPDADANNDENRYADDDRCQQG
jgi:hypothetical protein